jgi:hypothetical protein
MTRGCIRCAERISFDQQQKGVTLHNHIPITVQRLAINRECDLIILALIDRTKHRQHVHN